EATRAVEVPAGEEGAGAGAAEEGGRFGEHRRGNRRIEEQLASRERTGAALERKQRPVDQGLRDPGALEVRVADRKDDVGGDAALARDADRAGVSVSEKSLPPAGKARPVLEALEDPAPG